MDCSSNKWIPDPPNAPSVNSYRHFNECFHVCYDLLIDLIDPNGLSSTSLTTDLSPFNSAQLNNYETLGRGEWLETYSTVQSTPKTFMHIFALSSAPLPHAPHDSSNVLTGALRFIAHFWLLSAFISSPKSAYCRTRRCFTAFAMLVRSPHISNTYSIPEQLTTPALFL